MLNEHLNKYHNKYQPYDAEEVSRERVEACKAAVFSRINGSPERENAAPDTDYTENAQPKVYRQSKPAPFKRLIPFAAAAAAIAIAVPVGLTYFGGRNVPFSDGGISADLSSPGAAASINAQHTASGSFVPEIIPVPDNSNKRGSYDDIFERIAEENPSTGAPLSFDESLDMLVSMDSKCLLSYYLVEVMELMTTEGCKKIEGFDEWSESRALNTDSEYPEGMTIYKVRAIENIVTGETSRRIFYAALPQNSPVVQTSGDPPYLPGDRFTIMAMTDGDIEIVESGADYMFRFDVKNADVGNVFLPVCFLRTNRNGVYMETEDYTEIDEAEITSTTQNPARYVFRSMYKRVRDVIQKNFDKRGIAVNTDEIAVPALSEIAQMTDEEATAALLPFTHYDIFAAWGVYDAELSGMFGQIWYFDGRQITVYFGGDTYVQAVKIGEASPAAAHTKPNEPLPMPADLENCAAQPIPDDGAFWDILILNAEAVFDDFDRDKYKMTVNMFAPQDNTGMIIFTYYIDDFIQTNKAIVFSFENGRLTACGSHYSGFDFSESEEEAVLAAAKAHRESVKVSSAEKAVELAASRTGISPDKIVKIGENYDFTYETHELLYVYTVFYEEDGVIADQTVLIEPIKY